MPLSSGTNAMFKAYAYETDLRSARQTRLDTLAREKSERDFRASEAAQRRNEAAESARRQRQLDAENRRRQEAIDAQNAEIHAHNLGVNELAFEEAKLDFAKKQAIAGMTVNIGGNEIPIDLPPNQINAIISAHKVQENAKIRQKVRGLLDPEPTPPRPRPEGGGTVGFNGSTPQTGVRVLLVDSLRNNPTPRPPTVADTLKENNP